jgi:uncharacterized protein DUF4340
VLLLLLVLGAGALLFIVEAPPRRTGPESVRGPRVLRMRAASVRSVELRAGERHVVAVRERGGWRLDRGPAPASAAEALDGLVDALAGLRAVDAFRPERGAQLGLDPPAATITVRTAHRELALRLGAPNASGGSFYAERAGHPRVFLVGTGLLSAIERVFYQTGQRDLAQ